MFHDFAARLQKPSIIQLAYFVYKNIPLCRAMHDGYTKLLFHHITYRFVLVVPKTQCETIKNDMKINNVSFEMGIE